MNVYEGKHMDKKPPKKQSETPRQTFSLDEECLEIIAEAQADSEYDASKSAIIRKALHLLKKHRDSVKGAIVKAEKAKQKIKREK